MLISCAQFDKLLTEKKLSLALIGMSGMGKSYRSKQLAGLGFGAYSCDDLIEVQLKNIPAAGIGGVAAWMGQPYSEHHYEREAEYLDYENQVTRTALETQSGNSVIDTTGSVIYCDQTVQDFLKQRTLVIYLEASEAVYEKMFQVFLRDPKPIIWGNNFVQEAGETTDAALRHCYPALLQYRAGRYKTLADVVLPFTIARDEQSSTEQFLQAIRAVLPK